MKYGTRIGVYFLWKRTELESGRESLQNEVYEFPEKWNLGDADVVIELLKKAGLTVRFYDPEEKQWMDQSSQLGLIPAPGARDGSWSFPNLETFEKDYLGAI